MDFKENLSDVFIDFLTNAEYRAQAIAGAGIVLVGYLLLVFALTYPTQIYNGRFY